MRNKLSLAAAGLGAVLAASFAFAAEDTAEHFMKDAMQGNLAEIKVGDLAQHKGASQGVKEFGAMLAKDHADANEKAQKAAVALGMKTPSQSGVKEKAIYVELSALSGATFDKHFIKDMVKDHQEDIAKYEKEANGGSGPAAEYAKSILPDLHKHLEMAQRLQQEQRTADAADKSKASNQ